MPYNRRQLARTLLLGPAALAVTTPGVLWAQSGDFGGGEDPGNVFFSPCGRPFRAKPGAPYPVVDWFKLADANADGKIDHAEFLADTVAFFGFLDRNGDGVISPQEVAFYEQRIAPEVLGMRVEVSLDGVATPKARLWRTQGIPGGLGPGGTGSFRPGGASGPGTSVDPGTLDAGPDEGRRSRPYDASGKGAAPYGFFDEPEPVTAADIRVRGLVTKSEFLKLADVHFSALDPQERGYLTLDALPQTPVQRRLARAHRRR